MNCPTYPRKHQVRRQIHSKEASNMVIKIQLPTRLSADMRPSPADTRSHDGVQQKKDIPSDHQSRWQWSRIQRLQSVIRANGVKSNGTGPGLKAYFQADLEDPEKLVIRIGGSPCRAAILARNAYFPGERMRAETLGRPTNPWILNNLLISRRISI